MPRLVEGDRSHQNVSVEATKMSSYTYPVIKFNKCSFIMEVSWDSMTTYKTVVLFTI